MKCSFLSPTGSNLKAIGTETYKKLCALWKKHCHEIPDISLVARHSDSIIVVKDDSEKNVLGIAVVHKTSRLGHRTKTLREIIIPDGPNGINVLKMIVEKFAQGGAFDRHTYIFDDLGEVASYNRCEVYRKFGFSRNGIDGSIFEQLIPAKVKEKE